MHRAAVLLLVFCCQSSLAVRLDVDNDPLVKVGDLVIVLARILDCPGSSEFLGVKSIASEDSVLRLRGFVPVVVWNKSASEILELLGNQLSEDLPEVKSRTLLHVHIRHSELDRTSQLNRVFLMYHGDIECDSKDRRSRSHQPELFPDQQEQKKPCIWGIPDSACTRHGIPVYLKDDFVA